MRPTVGSFSCHLYHFTAEGSYQHVMVSRKESQISVKSNNSLELISASGRTEVHVFIKLPWIISCPMISLHVTQTLFSIPFRMAAAVYPSLIQRLWVLQRINTAASICRTVRPASPRPSRVWPSETCWAVCVRREDSLWQTSSSTFKGKTRSDWQNASSASKRILSVRKIFITQWPRFAKRSHNCFTLLLPFCFYHYDSLTNSVLVKVSSKTYL